MDSANLQGPMALPASGGAPRSMVILLHGYGSNGDDLIGLVPYWRSALPDTVFLSPNAPEPCPGAPGGRQWWALTNFSPDARAAGVRQAAPILNGFIDSQLAAYGLSEDRLALVGFSQGTMMALHVGLRRPIAGIVGYSGMLADAEGLAAAPSKPSGSSVVWAWPRAANGTIGSASPCTSSTGGFDGAAARPSASASMPE